MRLIVLYGSQTGTAQDVGEQIWRESKRYGFRGPVLPFDEFPIEQLIEEHLVIFVVATTGDGDEPDNMRQAWKFLLRRNLPRDSLHRLQFACLGLGDSSYTKFNFAAKKLNKRLQHLGAKELVPLGLCDDQHDHGFGAVALPWISGLWEELSKRLPLTQTDVNVKEPITKWRLNVLDESSTLPKSDDNILRWPYKQRPLEFTLLSNERTTTADHFQDVRFLQLKYPNGTTWNPGDVLDVRPCNSDEDVSRFFELVTEHHLDFRADTIVKLESIYDEVPLPIAYTKPVTIGQLAKYVWDLNCKPRQRAFELLALNCDDELEREKLIEFTTAEGLDELINYVNRPRRTLIEVLEDFRHATAKLTLPILCELFPFIQVRSFSIASVPRAAGGTLDLLVAVVEYKTKLSVPRRGLCSNWLKSLPQGSTVLGALRLGTMTLPKDARTPLIMIGPGTGIAPFRSIIQSRELEKKQNQMEIGKIIVFFGCRSRFKDYHFEADFKVWESTGLVIAFTAFSRDQAHKIYVQHLIEENRNLLSTLIKTENAVVLVAGSSQNMPKAVREAFMGVLDCDETVIDQMIKTKRYQEETWS